MATEQHILKDSTQSVIGYPPQYARGLGKISAVTHQVRTPSTDFTTAAAATYDTVDTTLSSAAAEGATSVVVASATNITAGREYIIGLNASANEPMVVRVASISGTTIYLDEPLPYAAASADLFFGWQVSHALLAAETDTEGEGLVIWNATIGGETVTWEDQFRIVRQGVGYTLNATRLTELMPMVRPLQEPQDGTYEETIRAAWEMYLVPRLTGRGLRPQRIHSWSYLEPWHAMACAYHLVRNSRRADSDELERWKAELATAADDALGAVDFWYDDTGENEVRDDENATPRFGSWRRQVN